MFRPFRIWKFRFSLIASFSSAGNSQHGAGRRGEYRSRCRNWHFVKHVLIDSQANPDSESVQIIQFDATFARERISLSRPQGKRL